MKFIKNWIKSINVEEINEYLVDTMLYATYLCLPAALLTLVKGEFGTYITYLLADLLIVSGICAVLASVITTYLLLKLINVHVEKLFKEASQTL